MGIQQLLAPAQFNAAFEMRWDVTDPVTQTFVPADTDVSGVPPRYSFDGVVQITINEQGLPVNRRECSGNDCDCNFWLGDPVLVARDPNPTSDPLDAPIRLKFSSPVRAVGAWIGVCPKDPFDTLFYTQPVFGVMWVLLAADLTNWHQVVSAQGQSGHACQPGTPLTAPFVGVRATGADRIVEVRFDALLLGNRTYEKFALSELTIKS